jgi:hypothetical protein
MIGRAAQHGSEGTFILPDRPPGAGTLDTVKKWGVDARGKR